MQRVHTDGLVAHVMEKENLVHLNIPAIAEERMVYQIDGHEQYIRSDGDVIDPLREDRETLDTIRRNMSSYNFTAPYLQRPAPPEGNTKLRIMRLMSGLSKGR